MNTGRTHVVTGHLFGVEVQRDGSAAHVIPRGELDIATAPELDAAIAEATGTEGSRLVIDLRGLSFMDSTGLRVLVGAAERAREGNLPLEIIRGTAVQRIFEVSGLETVLPLVDAPPDEAETVLPLVDAPPDET